MQRERVPPKEILILGESFSSAERDASRTDWGKMPQLPLGDATRRMNDGSGGQNTRIE